MRYDKLTLIETMIHNDLHTIENLRWHLKKLYEMRDAELEKEGIEKTEWEEGVKEILDARA